MVLLLCACGESAPPSTGDSDSARRDSDTADREPDSGDGGDGDGGDAGPFCADDEQINPAQCGTLCEAKDYRTDCENTVLPVPKRYFEPPLGHGCRWYTAYETVRNRDGSCTFGEAIHRCGYTLWNADACGESRTACGEEGALMEGSGAAVIERDGRTFLGRFSCPPQPFAGWTRCRWDRWGAEGPVYLTYDSPDICKCACEMEIEE